MYVNNPSYGLKLIDFIDNLNSDTIDSDLFEFTKEFLKPCKKYFYVNDEILFNNFCELFALNFYSRVFNFDTTFELNMKLRNILFLNKKKYEQIYKASLYEINPLNTYEHNIKDTESKKGESSGENSSNTTADATTKSETKSDTKSESSGSNSTNGTNYVSSDYEDKTVNGTLYNSSVTDTNKHLISNTPQSNLPVNDLFTSSKYVSNAENTTNTSSKSGTDTTTTTNTKKGTQYNDVNGSYTDGTKSESNLGTTTSNDSSSSTNGNNSNSFSDSREYQRIENGYNGSPAELLEMFSKIVFDVHKEIINDIESAGIFSKYFL